MDAATRLTELAMKTQQHREVFLTDNRGAESNWRPRRHLYAHAESKRAFASSVAKRPVRGSAREKAGRRILAAARQALVGQARISPELRGDSDFWFTSAQQDAPPVRNRSDEYGATIKADAISMLEIRAALAIAREDNAGGADADLIRSAARMLGFWRVGSDLQARLAAGLA